MSLINTSGTMLTFGRFRRIKPGNKIPAVDYTEEEASDIRRFLEKEILEERTAEPTSDTSEDNQAPVEADDTPSEADVTSSDYVPEDPETDPTPEDPEDDQTPEAPAEENTASDYVVDVSKMTKEQLKDFVEAKELGIELDMSKRVGTLRKEVAATMETE